MLLDYFSGTSFHYKYQENVIFKFFFVRLSHSVLLGDPGTSGQLAESE